jgi:hypothetical protein
MNTADAGAAAWPYHWSTAMLVLSSTHMTRPAPAIRYPHAGAATATSLSRSSAPADHNAPIIATAAVPSAATWVKPDEQPGAAAGEPGQQP